MRKLVGIIMGSDSDWEIMKEAAEILDKFGVGYEVAIVSAHRTPDRAYEYGRNAEKNGLEIIIAGAGGAAHLPGVIAALTNIPVIGVPIKTQALGGLDSLLSIVQMPSGVPVATVGINGAKNAGLLAIRILSLKHTELKEKLAEYTKKMREDVLKKSKALEEISSKDHA